MDVTPATQGSKSAWRREVMNCAMAENNASTTAQRRREPFCPAQNAENTKYSGSVREV